jgi:acetyl esterase/lipase
MKQLLDPELVAPLEGIMGAIGGGFDLKNLAATRDMLNGMIANVNASVPALHGVESEDRRVPGPPGAPDVLVRVYRPSARGGAPLPAILWMHPGGYVLGNIELDELFCRQLAKDLGIAVVSVNYRLAPEDPYPAALEDCYAVLHWLAKDASSLRVDLHRVAVGGASAGGGLAAALALLARDRRGPHIAFQLLVYPAIDDRKTAQASATVPDTLFWSRENTLDSWRAYLAGKHGQPDVPPYAAVARATDLRNLPPAYIPVGSLDPFLEDDIEFAQRLIAAGVAAELHVYPGAFHAFDVFGADSRVARRFAADRNAALRRALQIAEPEA